MSTPPIPALVTAALPTVPAVKPAPSKCAPVPINGAATLPTTGAAADTAATVPTTT